MTTPAPTVYLLEGADGTGKTTFAERVTAGHGRIVHNDVPPKDIDLYDLYLTQIIEAVHARDVEGITTVIDRSFLSEAIYGRHRAGGSRISKHQRRKLETYCKRNGIILLGFEAANRTRMARIFERGERWTFLASIVGPEYHNYFHGAWAKRFWTIVDSSSASTPN